MSSLVTKEKIKETVKEFRKKGSYIRQDYAETNSGNHALFVTVYDSDYKIKRTLTNDQFTLLLNSYEEHIDKKVNVFDWIFYSVMSWIEWDMQIEAKRDHEKRLNEFDSRRLGEKATPREAEFNIRTES